jgi:YegS/Rv2252/BmrU family lipid kinase
VYTQKKDEENAMRKLFIVNPSALRDKTENVVSKIKSSFGEDAHVMLTQKCGDAETFARTQEADEVYAVGGDGTVCETANGLAMRILENGYGPEELPTFAVIPAGSGNDFARSEYGTELTTFGAINDISTGKYTKQPFDVGKVLVGENKEPKFFVNIASVGFDAEIVKNAERYKKNPLTRRFSYILSLLYTIFKFKGVDVEIECNGKVTSHKMLLMAIANGRYYGGGIKIAPKADMNDGLFDVISAPMLSTLKVFTILPKLLNGSHLKDKAVTFVRADRVSVKSNEGDILLNLDGELFTTDSADFEVLPSAMNLYAKEDC